MKKITAFLGLSFIVLLFNGCTKSETCTPIEPGAEATQILGFASTNGMSVISHPSGIYYEIVNDGTGLTPDNNSKISVTYKTWYLDGSATGTLVDDETTPTTPLELGQFIEGWQIAVPLIMEGGRIKIIVPSSLAFGCQSHNGLPANAILYYDITLVSVE